MVRAIKPAEKVGKLWVIDEGLKPDERIVVEGLQKIRDGSLVSPKLANLTPGAN